MHKKILLAITLVTCAHNSSAMNTAQVPSLKELALKAALLNDETRDTLLHTSIVVLNDVRADAYAFLDKHAVLKQVLNTRDRDRAFPHYNARMPVVYVHDTTNNTFKKQGDMSSLLSAQLQAMKTGTEGCITTMNFIPDMKPTLIDFIVFGSDQKLEDKFADAMTLHAYKVRKRKKYAYLFPAYVAELPSVLQVPTEQNSKRSYKQWLQKSRESIIEGARREFASYEGIADIPSKFSLPRTGLPYE